MNNPLNEISAVYMSEISEETQLPPETAAAVSKHARSIRYHSRSEGLPLNKAFNDYVAQHNLSATERTEVRRKLGLIEDVNIAGLEVQNVADGLKFKEYEYIDIIKPEPMKGLAEKVSTKDAEKLNKASALSQSDDPKDQDRARARKVEVDYKDLMRQRLAKRKSFKQVALDKLRDGSSPKHQVGEKYDPMDDPDFDHDEAEKNRGVSGKNNPKGGKKLKDILKMGSIYGKNEKVDEEVGISSTDKMKAAQEKAKKDLIQQKAVEKQKKTLEKKEDFSNWREDLSHINELAPFTLDAAQIAKKKPKKSENFNKEITDTQKVNNKVEINPTLSQLSSEFQKIGGQLLEVTEVKEQDVVGGVALSPQEIQTQKRMAMLNVRLAKQRQKSLQKVKPQDDVKKEDYQTKKKGQKSIIKKDETSVTKDIAAVSKDEIMNAESYETKKKGEVLKALDKKKFVKRYGKEKAPDIMYAVAAKTAKKKGDTSKSDDRYAYEAASYETVKKGEVLGALKRDNKGRKKPLSVADRDKIADKVVKDKGDTSKSDDRYAYEAYEKLPRVKVLRKAGTLSRHGDEAEKKRSVKMVKTLDTHRPQDSRLKAAVNRRKSAPKLEGFEFVKKLVREDEAYKKTVKDLKDKFGTGVLASKQDFEDHKKREAAKPKPKVEPQKPLTDAEKAQKEVDAQYGGAENRKKGYGLGT